MEINNLQNGPTELATGNNNSDKESSFFARPSFTWGAVAGNALGALQVILYVIDESLLTNKTISYVLALALIALCIIPAVNAKKADGGYITFSRALGISMGTYLIATLFYTLWMVLLYFIIDPELPSRILMMGDEATKEAFTQSNMSMGAFWGIGLFFALLFSIVIGLIVCLIASAIIKKEPKYN